MVNGIRSHQHENSVPYHNHNVILIVSSNHLQWLMERGKTQKPARTFTLAINWIPKIFVVNLLSKINCDSVVIN